MLKYSTLRILVWVRDENIAYGDMSIYREESVNWSIFFHKQSNTRDLATITSNWTSSTSLRSFNFAFASPQTNQ